MVSPVNKDPHDAPVTADAAPGPGVRTADLSLDDLPPPDTQRWVTRRKAAVVAGVRAGLLTLEEALARYGISREEYQSWERLIDRHGVRGLRVTRIQQYRDRESQGGPA